MAQQPAPAKERITGKDITVHPFATIASDRKIDLKSKGVVDELKVTVTSDNQSARIRISGKKKQESGNLEGRPALHTGKLALVPFSERKGTLKAGEPSIEDVCSYFIVLELPDDKLETKWLKLEKGTEYEWSTVKKDDRIVFSITSAGKEIATVTAAADKVKSFGIASVVRWKGSESDVSLTIL